VTMDNSCTDQRARQSSTTYVLTHDHLPVIDHRKTDIDQGPTFARHQQVQEALILHRKSLER